MRRAKAKQPRRWFYPLPMDTRARKLLRRILVVYGDPVIEITDRDLLARVSHHQERQP